MATYTGLDRPKSKLYYQFWSIVFILGLCGSMALLYFATKKVEYIWRWNRVPQYYPKAVLDVFGARVDFRWGPSFDTVATTVSKVASGSSWGKRMASSWMSSSLLSSPSRSPMSSCTTRKSRISRSWARQRSLRVSMSAATN